MNNRLAHAHSAWLSYDVPAGAEQDCPECGCPMKMVDEDPATGEPVFECADCGERS